MKKKFLVLLLVLLCMLCLPVLTSCGGDEPAAEAYPELADVEVPENAEEASYDGFSAKYDADQWAFDSSLNNFSIYDIDDVMEGSASTSNVNVIVNGPYEGPLDEDDLDELLKQLEDMNVSGFEIVDSKLMNFAGEPLIYYEAETSLTDDMLDLMIESGSITEEQIEALGGREALMEMPAATQMGINAIVDGQSISVTGTYNDDKDHVLEAMKVLIKTGAVS